MLRRLSREGSDVERDNVGGDLVAKRYDLAIIGTGTAAIVTAHRVRAAGWSVAVADFRPRELAPEKLKKTAGIPELELVRNPDILSRLPQLAPRALRVGFAAETHDLEREARRKLEEKNAHLMVANDVSRSDIGFGSDDNEVTVHCRAGETRFLGRRPKAELARDLLDVIVRELHSLRREPAPAAR